MKPNRIFLYETPNDAQVIGSETRRTEKVSQEVNDTVQYSNWRQFASLNVSVKGWED